MAAEGLNLLSRLVALSSILAVLVVIAGTGVFAQKGTSIVTRISFARGRTTAIERGSVRRGMSHDYLLKARAGQTMTVHLVARGGVSFDILTSSGTDRKSTRLNSSHMSISYA